MHTVKAMILPKKLLLPKARGISLRKNTAKRLRRRRSNVGNNNSDRRPSSLSLNFLFLHGIKNWCANVDPIPQNTTTQSTKILRPSSPKYYDPVPQNTTTQSTKILRPSGAIILRLCKLNGGIDVILRHFSYVNLYTVKLRVVKLQVYTEKNCEVHPLQRLPTGVHRRTRDWRTIVYFARQKMSKWLLSVGKRARESKKEDTRWLR